MLLKSTNATRPHYCAFGFDHRDPGRFHLLGLHPFCPKRRAFAGHRGTQADVCHPDAGANCADPSPPGIAEPDTERHPPWSRLGLISRRSFRNLDLVAGVHDGGKLGSVCVHRTCMGGAIVAIPA
jgi:hypothetical protein